MEKIIRIILLIPGFFIQLFELSKNGSRDLSNKLRFKNAIIDSGCSINDNVKIEKGVRLFSRVLVNNSEIDTFSYVGYNSIIQNTTIGKFCSIANDVKIGLGNHPLEYFTTSPLFYTKVNPFNFKLIDNLNRFQEYIPVNIGHDVWIGANAIILDGISVGNGAVIAAGSVVTKDVPSYAIVGGVPAKIIKYRFTQNKIDKLLESKWWEYSIEEIKSQITELNMNLNEFKTNKF